MLPNQLKKDKANQRRKILGVFWNWMFEHFPLCKLVYKIGRFIKEGGVQMKSEGWTLFVLVIVLIAGIIVVCGVETAGYFFQRHELKTPTQSSDAQTTQWYLIINRLEYEKASEAAPQSLPAFRVGVSITSPNCSYPLKDSFPLKGTFFSGITNHLELGEALPLPVGQNQYAIEWCRIPVEYQTFTANSIMSNNGAVTVISNLVSIVTTNSNPNQGSKPNLFNINNLPAKQTNSIQISIPNSGRSIANLEIIYEITSTPE